MIIKLNVIVHILNEDQLIQVKAGRLEAPLLLTI